MLPNEIGGLVGTSNSYKYKPNNNPPPDHLLGKIIWLNIILTSPIYGINREVVANIETVIDGKKVCANVVEN